MQYITTGTSSNGEEIKIAFQDHGSGKPVILIHGWPLSQEMWEYQIGSLADAGYRVITYDRRGFGKSSKPYTGYDYDVLASDLNEIINKLDLSSVTLVGFSMGGGEVARYFTRYGGAKVSKVVLVSSILPYLLKTEDHPQGVPGDVFDKMAEGIREDRIGFLDDFGKTFFGVTLINKPISTPALEYYRMLASLASPTATLECAEAFAKTDFRKEVANITVPTLIIHGSSDKTVPISTTSDEAANLIPNNQYIKYEGAPHGLWFTHKDELNKDLLKFLAI